MKSMQLSALSVVCLPVLGWYLLSPGDLPASRLTLDKPSPAAPPVAMISRLREIHAITETRPFQDDNGRWSESENISADVTAQQQSFTASSALDSTVLELERIAQLELGSADALDELLPLAQHAVPEVRLAAIEAIGDLNTSLGLTALTAALNDPDPRLRIAALEALADAGDHHTSADISACLFDGVFEVRLAAIEALANLENEVAVINLAYLIGDPDARIRNRAAAALGEIEAESSRAFLTQMRHDPDATVRANAAAILEELGASQH